VFLVRHANPKAIHDWPDLIRPDVSVITPNPKTSGGARWNYLAAWGYAEKQPGGSRESAREFVTKLYKRVPVLDAGARGATTTFSERGIGDLLIAWESEALLVKHAHPNDFEIVVPSLTILTEPPVAIVEKIAEAHRTTDLAKAYLTFLYSEEGQQIGAANYYRPVDEAVLARHSDTFPNVATFTVQDVFGGITKAQAEHFADGGVFDQIYKP
jgi:sulfate transport system substrate-binding protein